MPAFAYRAVDPAGRASRGVVEASSDLAARRTLRERQLLPLSVTPTRGQPANADGPAPSLAAQAFAPLQALADRGLSARQLAAVTRQLSTLIGAGVRIEEALRLTAEAAPARARPLVIDVRSAVLDGRSLANALSQHPAAFPEFYRASVAAGEQSGRLPAVLAHLADFVEARHRNAQRVRLALLYPGLLAAVAGTMIVLLLIYVVPDIVRVFSNRDAELPFLTRALIGLSDFIADYGLVLLIALLVGAFLLIRWRRDPANRLRWHRYLATRRPFAAPTRQVNAARFAGSLATLVSSGVPLTDALAGAAAVTPNLHIRAAAEGVAARVREGSGLARALADSGSFPPTLVAVAASGEASGRLGEALDKAARDLDREVEQLAATLVALVEPAILLFMGGVVLLLVLAILLPIIGLNQLAI